LKAETVTDIHSKIIELCRQGESAAQFKLYNLYKKAMYNVCLRILNDRDEAEDVLQESFISAFKNIGKYEGRSTFGAWLKRIVINNALNHIKSKKLLFENIDGTHDQVEEANERDEEEMDLKVWKIKSALSELSDGFRSVLTLYLFEGYDHKEIGTILDITESTSKTQYLRAKRKLLEIMKEKYNE